MSRKRTIIAVKTTVNEVGRERMEDQLSDLMKRAIGKTYRSNGWSHKVKVDHASSTSGHEYKGAVTLSKQQLRERGNSSSVFAAQLDAILRRARSYGRSKAWKVGENDPDATTVSVAGVATPIAIAPVTPIASSLPSVLDPKHFGHIFDRDAQVRVVWSAIQSAVASGFRKRNHCLLWGKPACGKTEVLLAFERMVGSDNVVKLDATMTTKAGAENLILDMPRIPPLLILEEAEKVNPQYMTWLLGLMDQRGEIIKTNARIGSIRREARCLVLATVNNLTEFNSVMSGALASRFQHKIYCPRPNRSVLEKILAREVAEMGGKAEWIRPAIEYCIEVEKTDDPRRVIAVLDGRDRLLDGSYQADLAAIHQVMTEEASQG